MNRFNPYLLLTSLLFLTSSVLAQPIIENDELKTEIKIMGRKVEQIGAHVADAMKQIDIENLTKDVQEIAALSKQETQKLADQIAKMNLSDLKEQGQMTLPSLTFQKEKLIEKSYPVTAKHLLDIDNRYGKVTVRNWNRNEISIKVRIRTAESSERRAQGALDRVQIDESKSGSRIVLKTNIQSGDSNWWAMLTGGKNDRALQIDYEVYMPSKNQIAITNRYGAVELSDREGETAISVSYGSLKAGRLNALNNTLSIAYSKANITYINTGDVTVRYGEFNLAEADRLTLALSYTSGSEIGVVNREADVSLQYSGGFELGLGQAIQKVNIAAAYSSTTINPRSGAAFNFNVSLSYGGFDYDHQHTHINSQSGGNTAKNYTGYWNKTSNNSVNISSRYGKVSIN